jgi:hypothetical protein
MGQYRPFSDSNRVPAHLVAKRRVGSDVASAPLNHPRHKRYPPYPFPPRLAADLWRNWISLGRVVAKSHLFPFSAESEPSRSQVPHSQWRDRAGFSPDLMALGVIGGYECRSWRASERTRRLGADHPKMCCAVKGRINCFRFVGVVRDDDDTMTRSIKKI